MEDKMITQKELAERWSLAEATLERWRSIGVGPRHVKLMSRVRYWLSDIEAFEAAGLTSSTTPLCPSHVSAPPPQSPLEKKQQRNAEVFAEALSNQQAPSNPCYEN